MTFRSRTKMQHALYHAEFRAFVAGIVPMPSPEMHFCVAAVKRTFEAFDFKVTSFLKLFVLAEMGWSCVTARSTVPISSNSEPALWLVQASCLVSRPSNGVQYFKSPRLAKR